jgi:hypothetical protein
VLRAQKDWPHDCQGENRPHPSLVSNPEERPPIEKDIAKRPPTKGGQECNDGNTDDIEPFGGARENSGCRKSQYADPFENDQRKNQWLTHG